MNKIPTVDSVPGLKEVLTKCQNEIEQLTGVKVTVSFIIQFHHLSTAKLAAIICEVCEVAWADMVSPSKKGVILIARQLFCYFSHKYQKKSLTSIGKIFSRDHTNVIHSNNRVQDMIDTGDELYMSFINEIEIKIVEAITSTNG